MIDKQDMNDTVEIRVVGKPVQKGSMRAFVRGGRAIVTHDSKATKPWQSAVADSAAAAMGDRRPFDGSVSVYVGFLMPRPSGHLSTSKRRAGMPRPSAPTRPCRQPDLDKLLRCVLDALEGVVVTNDSRVVDIRANKHYADGCPPGCILQVTKLP